MHFPTVLALLISVMLSACLASNDPRVIGYDSIAALPAAHRRSALLDANPDTRARIWVERTHQYRDMHHDLTPDQNQVLDRFVQSVQEHAQKKKEGEEGDEAEWEQISHDAIAAFGIEEAHRIIASLERFDGKDGGLSLGDIGNKKKTKRAECDCGGFPTCINGKCFSDKESACTHKPDACGFAHAQTCTGICFSA